MPAPSPCPESVALLPANADPAWALGELAGVLFVVAVAVGLLTGLAKRFLVKMAKDRPTSRLGRFARSPWADAGAAAGTFVWGAALASVPGVLPSWVSPPLALLLGVVAGGFSAAAVTAFDRSARALGNQVLRRALVFVTGPSVGPTRPTPADDSGAGATPLRNPSGSDED